MTHRSPRPRCRRAVWPSVAAAMLLAACAGAPDQAPGPRLSVDDFRADGPQEEIAHAAAGAAEEEGDRSPGQVTADRVMTREEAGARDDVTMLTGPPVTFDPPQSQDMPDTSNPLGATDRQTAAARPAPLRPARTPPRLLVDQLVGQINGRPVFASEFFEPMDARLAAEAERLRDEPAGKEQWLADARDSIAGRLRSVMFDELFLAELEASLSPQEKRGLLVFVQQIRDQLVSESRGSEALANRTLQQREGRTLDEKVREQRDEELIRMQMQREIASKVYVAWREVQQEYNRRYDEFNPPASAVFRMMWIPGDDHARMDEAIRRLEEGEPFADVASDLSDFRRDQGGLFEPITLAQGGLSESDPFGPEALNEPARDMSEGDIVGPFDFSGRKAWLFLEEIRQDRRSLYEVQLDLYAELQQRRFNEEQARYFDEVLSRGNVTDMREMLERLLNYAVDRYWSFSD